jgi:uncharacterized RDD family membrane protein YckC
MSRTVSPNGASHPASPEEKEESPILIPGKSSTRLWAEIADVFMSLILGIVLYSVAFLPAFGLNGLTTKMQEISSTLVEEEVASHLVAKDSDGLTYSETEMQRFWINNYHAGNTTDRAGVSSDFLFDYYTLYRKEGLYSTADYNEKILGLPSSLSAENTSPYFAFDTNAADPLNALGVFSATTKSTLEPYYGRTQTTESVELYQNLKSYFTQVYETARDEFVESDPYRSTLLSYAEVFHQRINAFIGAAFVSYLTSAAVFFLLVPFIRLRGNTIGKKIFKLEVTNRDGSRVRVWQILSRGAVEAIEFSFLVPFMPLLNLGFDGFSLPLFTLGTWQVSLTALFVAGIGLSLASTLLMFLGKKHASLHDLASLSVVYTSDYAIIDAERSKREKAKEAEAENGGE